MANPLADYFNNGHLSTYECLPSNRLMSVEYPSIGKDFFPYSNLAHCCFEGTIIPCEK